MVNMSGSKFSYSMFGRIGWNGKIKGYTISASYYSSPKVTMPEAVFFKLDPDGNLVNNESQTTRSLELFEEAKPEILEYIRKIEEIYG